MTPRRRVAAGIASWTENPAVLPDSPLLDALRGGHLPAGDATLRLAAFAALSAGFHQPIRGGRDPMRWFAGAVLVVGGFGLLSRRRGAGAITLAGCGLALGAMFARPAPFDRLAIAAALVAVAATRRTKVDRR